VEPKKRVKKKREQQRTEVQKDEEEAITGTQRGVSQKKKKTRGKKVLENTIKA